MLYRVERLPDGPEPWMTRLTRTLAAIRPVTTSQLLAVWLENRNETFAPQEAVAAVDASLGALPARLFVDPELRRNPRAMVERSLPLMAMWKILDSEDGGYRLGKVRRHPQFPFVDDIIAHQVRFFEQTMENAVYAPGARSERARIRRDEVAPTVERRL
jgi:hypothetical protein